MFMTDRSATRRALLARGSLVGVGVLTAATVYAPAAFADDDVPAFAAWRLGPRSEQLSPMTPA